MVQQLIKIRRAANRVALGIAHAIPKPSGEHALASQHEASARQQMSMDHCLAVLSRFRQERRTSLGDPVDPEVDIRSVRSGWIGYCCDSWERNSSWLAWGDAAIEYS